MRGILFLAIALAIGAAVLLLWPMGEDPATPQGYVLVDEDARSGTVCCTFEHDGRERTCAVPAGQSCAVCESVC